jgi:hypothetical protein
MTCKYGLSANGRERARTLPTLAMQKVEGSSPFIRFLLLLLLLLLLGNLVQARLHSGGIRRSVAPFPTLRR